MRQQRTEEWFRWRFTSPKAATRFLFLEAPGRLVGYAALMMRIRKPKEGILIADLQAHDDEGRLALVRASGQWHDDLPLCTLRSALSPWVLERCAEFGMVPAPVAKSVRAYRPAILSKVLDLRAAATVTECGRDIERAENWDMRLAYSEAY